MIYNLGTKMLLLSLKNTLDSFFTFKGTVYCVTWGIVWQTGRKKPGYIYLQCVGRLGIYLQSGKGPSIDDIKQISGLQMVRITAVRCVSSHHNSTIYIVDSTAIRNRQQCSPSCPAHTLVRTTKQIPLSILVLYT